MALTRDEGQVSQETDLTIQGFVYRSSIGSTCEKNTLGGVVKTVGPNRAGHVAKLQQIFSRKL